MVGDIFVVQRSTCGEDEPIVKVMQGGRRQIQPETSATLHVVQALDQERWSGFVEGHPDGSIFHTPEMHRVFAETRHHRPAIWAAVDHVGEIHALMTPVAIATLGGPMRALTTRVVGFAGRLVAPGPDDRYALETLLRAYQRKTSRAPLFTELRNLAHVGHLGPSLVRCGFHHEDHLNFLVDLTPPEEELWQGVTPSARRNVQNALRRGVVVEEAADATEIAAGYEVLRDVYRRIRVPLPDRSLFDAAGRILGPLGRFKLLLARLGDRPIGVLTLLLYKEVVHYWYTGTLREYAKYRAGDLLVWHAIRSGRDGGHRVLEFGGAGRPNEPYGVRDFKAKFGGRLVNFGRDVWVAAPLRLRVSTAGYELVRRLL